MDLCNMLSMLVFKLTDRSFPLRRARGPPAVCAQAELGAAGRALPDGEAHQRPVGPASRRGRPHRGHRAQQPGPPRRVVSPEQTSSTPLCHALPLGKLSLHLTSLFLMNGTMEVYLKVETG